MAPRYMVKTNEPSMSLHKFFNKANKYLAIKTFENGTILFWKHDN